ncbi:MAG: lamin tail domain-containing protein, partial [Vicingaceae bacterium]
MEKQLFHLTLLLFNFLGIQGLSAQCSDLFISEYQEGSSYNKAVEVYNPTADSIDFTDYELQLFSNGSNSASQTFTSSHII